MIEDAGSRFGVTISGQPLSEPRALAAGQEIRLGNVVLRVESANPRARRSPAEARGWAAGTATRRSSSRSARRRWGCARPAAAERRPGPTAAALRLGAQAHRGRPRRGALRPARPPGWLVPAHGRQDARLLELLDGRHTIAELLVAGDDGRRPRGPRAPRAARSPTSASAGCSTASRATPASRSSPVCWHGRSSPASGPSTGCRDYFETRLPPLGSPVLLAAVGDVPGAPVDRRARGVRLSRRRPLRHAAGRRAPAADRRRRVHRRALRDRRRARTGARLRAGALRAARPTAPACG